MALFLQKSDHPREESVSLLRRCVKRVWGWDTLPEITRTEMGKPWFPTAPHSHFSLSHSAHFLLCALSMGEVGCDVEEVVPRRPDLPDRCLSAEELERFKAMGGDWPAFYTLWTEKEAAAKFLGIGLARDLKTIGPPEKAYIRHFIAENAHIAVCSALLPPKWIEILQQP